MARLLRVSTPRTTNGNTLLYDENMRPVYKVTILEYSALRNLEYENVNLPEHLRHKIEVIDTDAPKTSAKRKTK